MSTSKNGKLIQTFDHVDWDEAPIQGMVGALSEKSDDTLAFPLVFEYSCSKRRITYRKSADSERNGGSADGTWIDIDPRMSLKRAIELYGANNLYAYERIRRGDLA